ncbi:MAG: hypothetical protein IKB34_06900 [Clostridia bacterium]|nr:hypothetical protein [Clostridia bacterium]
MFWKEELKKRNVPEIWGEGVQDWESRRLEIADILQRELFGYRPADPEEISFVELPPAYFYNTFCAGKATLKKIEIRTKLSGKEFAFPMYAAIPKGKTNLPFFIHISFSSDKPVAMKFSYPERYQPTEELIDNGFAVFWFGYEDVTSDDMDFTNGLAGILYEGKEKTGSDPGKIPMWSWAASRVMDYCRTLDCLDFTKSAVVGHSRLGKTALFTGMLDQRFAFSISNDSGFAGAALSRNRADREKGKKFCSAEFCVKHHMQWFAENYRKYADNEEAMPYDQHFLVAASAPRAVYVASAVDDIWADPDTEYISACAAGEIYERLGKPGLVHPERYAVPGDVFHEGLVGYHMREGAHYLSREDWKQYMEYIRKTKV